MQLAIKYALQIILGWMACFNFITAYPLRHLQRDSDAYGETRLMGSNNRQDNDVEVKQLKELKGNARKIPLLDYARNNFPSYYEDYDYEYRDQKPIIFDPEDLAYYIHVTGNRNLVARVVEGYVNTGMMDEKEAVKYLHAIEAALKMLENGRESLNRRSVDSITHMLRNGKMKKDTPQTEHSTTELPPQAAKLPDMRETQNQSKLSSITNYQNMSQKEQDDQVIFEQGKVLVQLIFGKDGIEMMNTYGDKIEGLVEYMDALVLQGNLTKERKEEVLNILGNAAIAAFFGNTTTQSEKPPSEIDSNDNEIREGSSTKRTVKTPEMVKLMEMPDGASRKQVIKSILKSTH